LTADMHSLRNTLTGPRLAIYLGVLALMAIAVLLVCSMIGVYGTSWEVWQMRAMRLLKAATVGAALAAAGVALQGILRNPLAEPYILGISSGAGVGVLLGMAFITTSTWATMPALAFAGAMTTCAVVYFIAQRRGRIDPYTLLLSGVIVNVFNGAIMLAIFLFIPPRTITNFAYWGMGQFDDRFEWALFAISAGCVIFGWAVLTIRGAALNALGMGDDVAGSSGVDIRSRIADDRGSRRIGRADRLRGPDRAACVQTHCRSGPPPAHPCQRVRRCDVPDGGGYVVQVRTDGVRNRQHSCRHSDRILWRTVLSLSASTAIQGAFIVPNGSHILQIDGIEFAYRLGQPVLKGVSFSAASQRLICILGPNGSGKTTMLRCLLGRLKPQSGTILLDGRKLSKYSARGLARMLAYVPQFPSSAFALTVQEIILTGRYAHTSIMGLAGKVDLAVAHEAMKMTNTLQFADRALAELSGGEAQCVMIARALAQQPQVCLLDEPTSHLDIRNQLMVYRMMQCLAHEWEISVICVSHDVNLAARFADELVLMREGRIIASGRPEQVVCEELLEQVYDVKVDLISVPGQAVPQVLAR